MAPSSGTRQTLLLRATVLAMLLGVAFGWGLSVCNLPGPTKTEIVAILGLPTSVFLRLIRMIIAPLVLTTLVGGVSQMRGGGVGRIGLRTLLWFLTFSLVSITTGLGIVNLLEPGHNLGALPALTGAAPPLGGAHPQDILTAIVEFAPTSLFDALAQNRILQIVVFSIFAGLGLGALGDRAKLISEFLGQAAALLLKIAGYIMAIAPLAVFAALASTVLSRGIGAITMLGGLVLTFYLALAAVAVLITLAGFVFLRRRVFTLVALMREPLLVAFSTSSSEAAYASSLEQIQLFGVSRRIAGFVLPLGYSFNLDGTMVYSALATVFIAQAYGINLSLLTQVEMMLFLLLTSKGAAGVPRGALLGLAVALEAFRLPQSGLLLVVAVDAILDMGRTTVNVFGNAVAAAAIAKMEGELSVTLQ